MRIDPLWMAQIRGIIQLEMRKTFFARRGLWIYILALLPVAMFAAHSAVELYRNGAQGKSSEVRARSWSESDIESVHAGMSRAEVLSLLGEPSRTRTESRRIRRGRQSSSVPIEVLRYRDKQNNLILSLENGIVTGTQLTRTPTLGEDSYVFAGVFQFFFIRLAIFFGCLGIFMNLFRGEMLDKSLHYYLLTPVRRDVLLCGKFAAGLLAAAVIFTVSVVLQMIALLCRFDGNAIGRYLSEDGGIHQIAAYLGVTILACIGYGSIFLAAGLLFRNPIIPAAAVLIWEAINPILPALLKKLSIIYYLKALCPVDLPTDPGMPALLVLLVSRGNPVSHFAALTGVAAVSIAVLLLATQKAKRLEINYGSD